MKKKSMLVLLLALVMVFTFAVSVMAADYSDTENHWANAQIEKWSDEGILQGSDGKFRPSDSITRGEMAIILDRIMDYQVKAKNSFGDLASEAYFTDAILKANASGVILGDAGKVRPKDYITREEAAVMLGRAFGLTASANASSNFTDKANVASWASAMVLTMEQKGFIGGTDGKFLPKNNISRAEVVKIVDNIIKGFVTKAGTYTANVEGTLVVNAPNVILKGITIGGDLVVAPGVGEGEITLDNVTVKGNLVVKGGGVNSIVIKGNSDIGKVLVTKVGNQVRVVTEGNADVEIVVVDDGSDDVVLTGSFGDVQVNASDVVVKAVDASITNAKIEGTKSKIVLDAKSTVNTLTLSAAGAEVSGDKGAVVKSVVAESTAKGAEITGNITVEKAEVKANNVAVNTVGTKVTVSAGVTGTTSNGNTVNAGTTVTTTTTAPSTSTGSGGGGGSSTVAVSAISVKGTGDATTIETNGGTLQMIATVSPDNASNKSVTWSVDEPEIATISNTGLLTAKTNGTVTVTAAAKDSSGKKGTIVVTVSGQEKTLSVATIGSLRIPATEEIFAWANGYDHSIWNGLNVTGTLYKVHVETSTPAFGADSGETHFLPFAITAPADVADGATVKITGKKGGETSSFTYKKSENHFESDNKTLQVLWALEAGEDELTIEVNWGAGYTAKTYTLNLKGLTLSDTETPPLKVVSIEKNSVHITGDNNITVDAAGNVVTIGGKIPYQAESILGHAEGSYLYEFKVTLDNLLKDTAACKTVGSTTNTYAAADNWMDGDDFFYFVGKADKDQDIVITIDNDGDWKTTGDQLTITVKVDKNAQLGEDSTATITLDGEDAHSNTKYNGENHDLKLSSDLKVTGTLKYYEKDPTEMNFADYDKHFLVFTIKDLPEAGAKVTVKGKAEGSDSSTTYKLDKSSEVFVWGVEKGENIEITVDYGTGFVPNTYTLDLSGVTLNSAFNKVEVAKSDNHIKNANDTTVAIEGNTITIGGTIPWQEAGILGHDAGNLYELKFTFENINKETAACKTEGSQTNEYAAADNWMDGDDFFYFVGKADKDQDIVITIDNDGDWETTEDQVSYTIKIATDAELKTEATEPVFGVKSIAKSAEYVKSADGTTVTPEGNTITIGGTIPYQVDSILGHEAGSNLYELKFTLENVDKTKAAFKAVGSQTNTYAAADNWMDGDDFFYFVGKADKAQEIVITIDNDGDWATTEDQVSYTIKIATDATLATEDEG